MIGVAIGCIGMRWAELDAITMTEFDAIVEAWYEQQHLQSRERWEQTRMLALYTLAPHSRKSLYPRDILEFEWEKREVSVPVSTESDFLSAEARFSKF